MGDIARFVRADIIREEDGQVAVVLVLEAFGSLHRLVNCVGIVLVEKVLGCNGAYGLDSFRRTVEVNLIGSFNLLCLVVEVMVRNMLNVEGERGVIINIVLVVVFDG